MQLSNIVGHTHIRKNFIDSIKLGNFSHACLISGEDGIGKSFVALEAAINIIGKECYKQYADIIECRIADNKKSISVDQIREIIEEANRKPYEGNRKVIIIHNSDKMTIQAQNAFLKTIEEPPEGVFILLLCENQENILDTIKSRCQIYKLKKLSEDEIDKFICNKYPDIDEDEKKAVKAFADGIPGRIVDFIDNDLFKEMREKLINILANINDEDMENFLKNEEFLTKSKDMWQEVLTCLLSYIRDIIVYKETGISKFIINLDKILYIKKLAEVFSYNKLNSIIDIINNAKSNLESNVNVSMTYHIMLLNMKEAK
ncbi:DNA polymerase III subunit delta' [Clostridium pasteurianum]|nr:DNA polymerase III subunit delta' [Clostridium pasteurianum]AOZ73675.1 DNA polymerase III subunit delta' [Clostridium pasteurianum DSM 525 = ATCC 6013]AOZ77472.1 DNA polymerase III subunit delta' [Clostridium pasteurianum]ELP60804.1 DNA polymerase III subunit delta' [Clostridium pasteurianum DSM 525 = ATCC 6013]UZW14403.1 DNA polymerase III subunit delta' [Clostridium pasteurianum]